MQLDSVQIGVADLDGATREYQGLLGVPSMSGSGGVRRFQLETGAVEIEPGTPGLHSLGFTFDGEQPADWPASPTDFHGLDVRVARLRVCPLPVPLGPGRVCGIDHIVVHSADLERAIALWRDRLGLRLALDRTFPKRGLRMLFFRSGGMTLELVSSAEPSREPAGSDRLHGVAYRVGDLYACRNRLLTAGVEVSEIRPGHKMGTAVATVRSGTAGVPTLLIEDRSRLGNPGPGAAEQAPAD